jgi:hypothetical protein
MGLKPWREVAVPYADVLKGTFQQDEFAADITEGIRLLLTQVAQRLNGWGGEPVIQLQNQRGHGDGTVGKARAPRSVARLPRGDRAINPGAGSMPDRPRVGAAVRLSPSWVDRETGSFMLTKPCVCPFGEVSILPIMMSVAAGAGQGAGCLRRADAKRPAAPEAVPIAR